MDNDVTFNFTEFPLKLQYCFDWFKILWTDEYLRLKTQLTEN